MPLRGGQHRTSVFASRRVAVEYRDASGEQSGRSVRVYPHYEPGDQGCTASRARGGGDQCRHESPRAVFSLPVPEKISVMGWSLPSVDVFDDGNARRASPACCSRRDTLLRTCFWERLYGAAHISSRCRQELSAEVTSLMRDLEPPRDRASDGCPAAPASWRPTCGRGRIVFSTCRNPGRPRRPSGRRPWWEILVRRADSTDRRHSGCRGFRKFRESADTGRSQTYPSEAPGSPTPVGTVCYGDVPRVKHRRSFRESRCRTAK